MSKNIRKFKRCQKKAFKKAAKKADQVVMNVAENLCKKPFKYRFIFAWDILIKRNPFTGKRVKK